MKSIAKDITLSRKHELYLIKLGLEALLERATAGATVNKKKEKPAAKRAKRQKWSRAQHEKFSRTMAKKWAAGGKKWNTMSKTKGAAA